MSIWWLASVMRLNIESPLKAHVALTNPPAPNESRPFPHHPTKKLLHFEGRLILRRAARGAAVAPSDSHASVAR